MIEAEQTINSDINQLSTDEMLMNYLSKKSIVERTEKLALDRIASNLKINNQQLEMSINRLSTKNFIRKIYQQGKVGFELTPKGKSLLEANEKVKTAHIESKLQEAIFQEKQAKLRLETVNKVKSIENEWQNIQIPDATLSDKIEQAAIEFLDSTKEIQTKQPLCQKNPQSYDQDFLQFKSQIEKLIEQNINIARAISNFIKIKNYQKSIAADIKSINRAISRYNSILEAATQINQLTVSLGKLKIIQSDLESFDNNQLSRFEELKNKLSINYGLLEFLKKPTHEFTSIRNVNLTEKTILYPDPEVPTIYNPKTNEYSSLEKCVKCGTIRKATPINIG